MNAKTRTKAAAKPRLAFSASTEEGAASSGAPPAPRSIMRVLGILSVIAQAQAGLGLAELSTRLGAPKSSLLMLLRALVAEGYLTHYNSLYEVGPLGYRLASDILAGRRFPKMIRPYMQELMERTQETVILAVLDRDAQVAVYIEVVESPRMVRYSVPPGTSRPLYASTAGRVLLAYQDEAWRQAYFARNKLKALTPTTITEPAVIKTELEKIRARGYAVVKGQTVEDAAGISAPIFDSEGAVIGALTIGCPADRLEAQEKSVVKILLDVTRRACGVFRGQDYAPGEREPEKAPRRRGAVPA